MKREDVKVWQRYKTKVGGVPVIVQVIRPDTGKGFLVASRRNIRRFAEELSEAES